jgi:hypothetical protein
MASGVAGTDLKGIDPRRCRHGVLKLEVTELSLVSIKLVLRFDDRSSNFYLQRPTNHDGTGGLTPHRSPFFFSISSPARAIGFDAARDRFLSWRI